MNFARASTKDAAPLALMSRQLAKILDRSLRFSFNRSFRPICAGMGFDFPDDDSVLLNGRRYVTAR